MKKIISFIIVTGLCLSACEKGQDRAVIIDPDKRLSNEVIPYLQYTVNHPGFSKDTCYSVEAYNMGYPCQLFIGGSNSCVPWINYLKNKYYTHKTGFIFYDRVNTDRYGTWIPDKELMIGIPFPCGTDETQESFYSILDIGEYDYAVWDSSYADRRKYALEDDFYYFFVDYFEYTHAPVVDWIEEQYSSKWGEQDETCYMRIVEVMKQPPVCGKNIPAHIVFKAQFSCKLYDKAGNFSQRIDNAEMVSLFVRMNPEPDYPVWEDWCANCVNYDPSYLYY